jgi:hypothetical protein
MFRRIARWLALVCALSAMSPSAFGQSLDPECPRSLVVGSPASSPASLRASLPTGTLRVAWRRTIGPSIEHAPLVTADGKILVFTVRGDLVELDEEGAEEGRVGIGVGSVGPGAILSDGTVVTVDMAGEAVGVLGSRVRFRTRVGDRGVVVKPAPLALDDGGVVVANGVKSGASDRWTSEIVALDAEGHLRARAQMPEQIVWPLVATDGGIAAVSASGTVYLWSPGQEPRRAGSFGGMLDGGVAARDGNTLVGVVDTARLVAVDLVGGSATVLAVAGAGVSGAGALLGPPSVSRGTTFAFEMGATSTRVLAVDSKEGATVFPVATYALMLEADGSPSPVVAPIHTATLVDASGTVAFAGPDGHVGVVTPAGVTELGEVICGRGPPSGPAPSAASASAHSPSRPSAGFAGMAFAGPGAFLVACEAGSLLEIRSDPAR